MCVSVSTIPIHISGHHHRIKCAGQYIIYIVYTNQISIYIKYTRVNE